MADELTLGRIIEALRDAEADTNKDQFLITGRFAGKVAAVLEEHQSKLDTAEQALASAVRSEGELMDAVRQLETRLVSAREQIERFFADNRSDWATFLTKLHNDLFVAEGGQLDHGDSDVERQRPNVEIKQAETEFNPQLAGTDAMLTRSVTKEELEAEYGAPDSERQRQGISPHDETRPAPVGTDSKQIQCIVCGAVYDEPEHHFCQPGDT